MEGFNSFERAISKVLSYFPGIKYYLKWLYQYLIFIINKKKYTYRCNYPITLISYTTLETFFGYYDKSPQNIKKDFLLFQKSKFKTNNKPDPHQSIEIVLTNQKHNTELVIGESNAYNWQQGTKLQWLSEYSFIYNIFDNATHTYKSRIIDARDGSETNLINYPIYDCFKEIYALSLNFDRLAILRPDYGYLNHFKNNIDLNNIENDGVFFINLKTSEINLLISLKQLKDITPLPSMRFAKHKVNHIMISPDGEGFVFMHRWYISGGKRYDRLLFADKNGKNIKVLADGMISHYCWSTNNEIIVFFRHKSYGDAFYVININTLSINLVSSKLLRLGDGHPSVINDIMVFDSYPDRSRMKKLYLYNIKNDTLEIIGEFLEPLKYFGQTRCDLHPKFNSDGSSIYIDSVHEGRRMLYEINVVE